MHRLLAAALLLAAFVLPGTAMAQQPDLDCGDFDLREDAQAILDSDPSDPHDLDGNDDDGLACEGLPLRGSATPTTTPTSPTVPASTTTSLASTTTSAAPTTTSTTIDDLNCTEDFTYQEEAQAVYDADPSDPHGLDGPIGPNNGDGIPCEELPSRGTPSNGHVTTPPGRTLPKTGSTSVPLTVTGTALLAMGAGFVLVSRRRSQARAAEWDEMLSGL